MCCSVSSIRSGISQCRRLNAIDVISDGVIDILIDSMVFLFFQTINLSERRHDLSKMNPKVRILDLLKQYLFSIALSWSSYFFHTDQLCFVDVGYRLARYARSTFGQDLHHLQSHGELAQRWPSTCGCYTLQGELWLFHSLCYAMFTLTLVLF